MAFNGWVIVIRASIALPSAVFHSLSLCIPLFFLAPSLSVCIVLWQRPAPADLWTRTAGGQLPVAVWTQRPLFRTATPCGWSKPQDDTETDITHAEDDEASQKARGCCRRRRRCCCIRIFSVSNTDICCSMKGCIPDGQISGLFSYF